MHSQNIVFPSFCQLLNATNHYKTNTIPLTHRDALCSKKETVSGFRKRSLSSVGSLLDAVLLVELIHAAAGVNELLLAGVERVALGADLDGDVLLRGAGLVHGAAGAADGGGLVIRMDTGFHSQSTSSNQAILSTAKKRVVTRRKWDCNIKKQELQEVLKKNMGQRDGLPHQCAHWFAMTDPSVSFTLFST